MLGIHLLNQLRFGASLIGCLLALSPAFTQDSTQQILMIPFGISNVANPECSPQDLDVIAQKLKTSLNRSKIVDVRVVTLYDEVRDIIIPESLGRLQGFLTDPQFLALRQKLYNSTYSYLLLGQVKVMGSLKNIIAVECQVINVRSGKIDFYISSHKLCESRFEEALTRELQNQFEINLARKIRIGILNFKMTYCSDSSRCPALQEAIPTMLGTGLSISEAITLVEMKEIDQLLALITSTRGAREGIYDRYTALEIGHIINVNYLIMGEYWYLDKNVRIDSRCVNIETGEIILSKGITIDAFSVRSITEKINDLATEIRTSIEEDLLSARKTLKEDMAVEKPAITLSVVCFPPYPNNRSNRLRASQIRKTISSKLRLVEALSIKDDVDKIDKYLSRVEDRMKITSGLNISHLLSIEFENYNDQQYLLSADAYDSKNPTRTYFKDIQKANALYIDAMIDSIVFNYLINMNLLNTRLKDEIQEIKVPTYLERFSLGVKAGSIRRSDQEVFLNDGIGEYAEVFVNYNIINKIKFELIFGIDFGKSKKITSETEVAISGLQPGLVVKYNLRESKTINPYVGLGLSALLIPRSVKAENGNLEEAGDIRAGILAFGGIEFAFQGLPISIYLEPRFMIGQAIRSESTRNGFTFKQGALGGLYIIGGVGYNFNY